MIFPQTTFRAAKVVADSLVGLAIGPAGAAETIGARFMFWVAAYALLVTLVFHKHLKPRERYLLLLLIGVFFAMAVAVMNTYGISLV